MGYGLAVAALVFLVPLFAKAQLVPCGEPGNPCELCHLFVLFDNIVKFVLVTLVPPIAIIMLIGGGLMFYFSVGDPEKTRRATAIIRTTVFGMLIIYFAWSIVVAVFTAVGAAQWQDWWYTISC